MGKRKDLLAELGPLDMLTVSAMLSNGEAPQDSSSGWEMQKTSTKESFSGAIERNTWAHM